MNIVHRGVDSLEVRLGFSQGCILTAAARDLFAEFELAKERVRETGETQIFKLGKVSLHSFRLLSHGTKVYRFILACDEVADIKFWKPDGWNKKNARQTGQVFVAFRSKWLLEHGVSGALKFLEHLAAYLVEGGRRCHWVKVGRGDLCADIECDRPLHLDDFKKFQTRARTKHIYVNDGNGRPKLKLHESPPKSDNKGGCNPQQWLRVVPDDWVAEHFDQPDTVYFGQMTNPLYCRIYNKRKQAERKGLTHWEPVWEANGARPDSYIYRVEFPMDGEFLKEIHDDQGRDCRDADVFVEKLADLWTYLTGSWLVQTERAANGTGREAIPTEFWSVVIRAYSWTPKPSRSKVPKPNLEELWAQIKGCILTYCAKRGHSHQFTSVIDFADELTAWMFSDEMPTKVSERRERLGMTDTNIKSNYLSPIRKTYMCQELDETITNSNSEIDPLEVLGDAWEPPMKAPYTPRVRKRFEKPFYWVEDKLSTLSDAVLGSCQRSGTPSEASGLTAAT
ncbi:hypothetical protein [Synechococcus elongatus]|uniref:hypothetical protein n=1 Tax=Synechococcus elongatus TaxID=32046 RepID=UPI0030D27B4A